MTKAKDSIIPQIPANKLVSQPINNEHRQEFVVEFTRIIFKPKIIAALPQDIANPQADIELQLSLLKDAFPFLAKKEFRDIYGRYNPNYNAVVFPHRTITQTIDTLKRSTSSKLFGINSSSSWGTINAFSNELAFAVNGNLPNVTASEDLLTRMHDKYNSTENASQQDHLNVWLPVSVKGLADLITEKKVQAKDGAITRTPIIKKQYAAIVPKGVQAKILKWEKLRRKDPGAAKLEQEICNMYKFSQQLYEAIRIVRNTKQFQQRYPEMFDEFCGITGLGQCDGKSLIATESMDMVNSILGEWKKGRG
ncbi:MAG: hypothetical protein DRR06_15715 [Gammaproteobacteria bacterium]|nr:MAG: hypothetical protein DRR06_15715 [Gammaproteobacteria bacterium]